MTITIELLAEGAVDDAIGEAHRQGLDGQICKEARNAASIRLKLLSEEASSLRSALAASEAGAADLRSALIRAKHAVVCAQNPAKACSCGGLRMAEQLINAALSAVAPQSAPETNGDCPACSGDGRLSGPFESICGECSGTGKHTPADYTIRGLKGPVKT